MTMRPLLAAVIVAVLCPGGGAAAEPEPPPPPPGDVWASMYRSADEAALLLGNPETCSECKRITGIFYIDYEMHSGFHVYVTRFDGRVYRQTPDKNWITPILSREMAERFWTSLRRPNSDPFPGYCECSGWTIEHNGRTYFRIDEARLHPGS